MTLPTAHTVQVGCSVNTELERIDRK